MGNLRNAGEGTDLKDELYKGLNVSDEFKQAYGKNLDKYADKYKSASKEFRGARINLKDFNDELVKGGEQAVKTTTFMNDLKSGVKSFGKTALASIGNAGLDMLIGTGISLAVQGISDWINRDQIAIEKGQEAQSTIKSTFDEFSNGKTTLNTLGQSFNKTENQITNTGDAITSVAEKYTELAKGVNSKTNANMTLSDEDYQTYLDLSSQLATLYPQLQAGLDSQGNAMLNLGTNAKTAAKDIQNLYNQQMTSSNVKIGAELQTQFKGVQTQVSEYQKQVDKYQSEADDARANAEKIKNSNKTLLDNGYLEYDSATLGDKYGEYTKSILDGIHQAGINNNEILQSTFPAYDEQGNQISKTGIQLLDNSKDAAEKVSKAVQQAQNDMVESYSVTATEADKQVASTTALIQDQWKSMSDSLGQYLQTTDSFDKLDTGIQNALLKNMGNIDISKLSKEYDGDALQMMYDQFIMPLSDLSKDSQKALADVFDIDQAKTTASDYANQVNDALEKAFPNNKDLQQKWKDNFGLTSILDENQRQLDAIKEAPGLQDAANQIEGLTGEDRQIAYDLVAEDNFSGTFEQLQAEIEKTKNTVSGDNLLSGLQGNVKDIQTQYSNISSAISESMSDTGLTADSISTLKDGLQSVIDSSDELKDYDLNALFTNTSKGVKLDNDRLEDLLDIQHQIKEKDFAESIQKQNDAIDEQSKALETVKKGTDEYTEAQDNLKTAQEQLAEMQQAQSQYYAQYQQQKQLFSDYAEWQRATQTENSGDKYLSMVSGLDTAKKAWDAGEIGTDDFKSFAKMISPSGATDPVNFAENYAKAARYLTSDESGLVHFFEDLSTKTDAAGQAMASFNEETQSWELNTHDLGEVAQKLGTGTPVVEALFGRAEDYGATTTVISDMQDGILKATEATKNWSEAKARLDQMNEENAQAQKDGKDPIYNTTAIKAAEDEVAKYKQQIDGLQESMDYYAEHNLGSEAQQKKIKTAADEIKNIQEQVQAAENANNKALADSYRNMAKEKAAAAGITVDDNLNVTGDGKTAQEQLKEKSSSTSSTLSGIDFDYDKTTMSLDQIDSKIKELQDAKVNVDVAVDGEDAVNTLDTEISSLEAQKIQIQIQTAVENGNSFQELLTLSDQELMTTVGCDASQVDQVRDEIREMSGEQVDLTVAMDSTQFVALINAITGEKVEIPSEVEQPQEPDTSNIESTPVEIPSEVEQPQEPDLSAIEGTPVTFKSEVESPDTPDIQGGVVYYKAEVEDATTGNTSSGTIDYKKGNVEKADGETSEGTINYEKGTVQKADGEISTGTINYDLGSVAVPTGIVATGTINYTLGSVAQPHKASGTMNSPASSPAHATGTIYSGSTYYNTVNYGSAYANGKIALDHNETALVNELGQESIIRGDRWLMLPPGMHTQALKRGDIVLNARQTSDLINHGKATGTARAFAHGSLKSIAPAHADVGGATLKFQGGLASPKYGNTKSTDKTTKAVDKAAKDVSKAAKDSSKWTDPWKNVKDWFERVVTKLQGIIDLNKAKSDNTYDYNKQNSYANNSISTTETLISKYRQAEKMYTKKSDQYAKKIGLSSKLKKKVQNGTVNIESLSAVNKQKVDAYQKWYDKILNCKKQIEELKTKEKELYKQKLDNITTRYDALIGVYSKANDSLDGLNSWREEIGASQVIGSDYYNAVQQKVANGNQMRTYYKDEISALTKEYGNIVKKYGADSTFAKETLSQIEELKNTFYENEKTTAENTNKLAELNMTMAENAVDKYTRASDALSSYRDFKEKNSYKQSDYGNVTENDYVEAMKVNDKTILAYQHQKDLILTEMAKVSVDSPKYQEYAKQLADVNKNILEANNDTADLKKSLVELRFKPLEDARDTIELLVTDLDNLRDMMDSDTFMNDDGSMTKQGLANIALLNKASEATKQQLANDKAQLETIQQMYDNDLLTEDQYKQYIKDVNSDIQKSSKAIYSYQQSLMQVYLDQISKENDYLQENINKRKTALTAKKDYYDYDKTLKSKNKDIDTIKAQIAALEGTTNASAKARLEQLKADLKDKEDDLADTKYQHQIEMEEKGYENLSDQANETLDKTTQAVKSNSDLQKSIIDNMLKETQKSYADAYEQIEEIIKNTGYSVSESFDEIIAKAKLTSEEVKKVSPSVTASGEGVDNQRTDKNQADQYTKNAANSSSTGANATKDYSNANPSANDLSESGTSGQQNAQLNNNLSESMKEYNAKKSALQQWYKGVGGDVDKTKLKEKHHDFYTYFWKKGKNVRQKDFEEVARILGHNYIIKQPYSKWKKSWKDKIFNELKGYGFSNGGVINSVIPMDSNSIYGEYLSRSDDTGMIFARPGESVMTEKFTELLKPSLATMDQFTKLANPQGILPNTQMTNQDITFSPNIKITVDSISNDMDLKHLGKELSDIMYPMFTKRMRKDLSRSSGKNR